MRVLGADTGAVPKSYLKAPLGLFTLDGDGEQAWGRMDCHWLYNKRNRENCLFPF